MYTEDRQFTAVLVVHAAVKQIPRLTLELVAVGSIVENPKPTSVKLLMPDFA